MYCHTGNIHEPASVCVYECDRGLPGWLSGQESTCLCRRRRRRGFNPRVGVIPWRRKWQPTPVFLPGNPKDRGAWRATVHGVSKRQARLRDWQPQRWLCFAHLSRHVCVVITVMLWLPGNSDFEPSGLVLKHYGHQAYKWYLIFIQRRFFLMMHTGIY